MNTRFWRNFDLVMLTAVLALVAYGIAMIYSASQVVEFEPGILNNPPVRQLIFALVGLVILGMFAAIDYRFYRRVAWWLYGFLILTLVVILFVGSSTYGASRWIDLGVIQFQPSEIGKVIVIVALARFIGEGGNRIKQLRFLVASGLLVAIPMLLVFLEPDLGTVAVYAALWLAVVFVAGARIWHLGLLILPAVAIAPILYGTVLRDYMRARFETFLDPAADALGAGYNILQAEIGIGSGGLFGKGFLEGTQSQLHFLRIQRTDYIFSVLGEELGFVGGMVLFVLLAIVIFRGVRVASQSSDAFGRFLSIGVVTTILVQSFVNIAVNVRLVPATGIPLPFISLGGTSLLSMLIAIGIVESIALRRRRSDRSARSR